MWQQDVMQHKVEQLEIQILCHVNQLPATLADPAWHSSRNGKAVCSVHTTSQPPSAARWWPSQRQTAPQALEPGLR